MIDFNSGAGSLFYRLGKLGLLVKQVKSFQTSQLANLTNTTTGVVAQYNAESDIQALVGSAYIGQLNNPGTAVGGLVQNVATQTVNRVVFRDDPQLNQTLQQVNLLASLQEIILQMREQAATILAATITLTNSSFTGTGNGTINSSAKRPSDGLVLENAYGENVLFTCTNDSYVGDAIAGNEGFQVTGAGTLTNFFAFNWPLGSNCSVGVSAIDATEDVGGGNFLTNSDFEDWTANVPDNWTLVVGTAGTNIARQGTIVYTGSYSLEFIGAGGTATQIRQQFDSSSGTLGELDPLTQYSVALWLRRDGTAAAAGVLTVDLTDSSGNVVADENAVNNSFTVDLTALTTTFAAYKGVFRTPHVMPSSVYLRLRTSTPLTNGRSVYLDHLSLGQMTQCYVSGPYVAVHSGSTNFVQGDYGTVTVTNSRGAAGTLSTFQTLLAQFFPSQVYGNELLFPSASSPTISDGLIG